MLVNEFIPCLISRTKIRTVFLDLPAPWEAIEHAKVTLRASHSRKSAEVTSLNIPPERPPNTNMLLQPVHGAGPTDCQRVERSRIYG